MTYQLSDGRTVTTTHMPASDDGPRTAFELKDQSGDVTAYVVLPTEEVMAMVDEVAR